MYKGPERRSTVRLVGNNGQSASMSVDHARWGRVTLCRGGALAFDLVRGYTHGMVSSLVGRLPGLEGELRTALAAGNDVELTLAVVD